MSCCRPRDRRESIGGRWRRLRGLRRPLAGRDEQAGRGRERQRATMHSGPHGKTMNEAALVAVAVGVVTVIGPLDAVAGTVARMTVDERVVKLAGVPLKVTVATSVNPVPTISIVVPAARLPGANVLIASGGSRRSTIEPMPTPSAIVAFVAELRFTEKVSTRSRIGSALTSTAIVCVVSPGANTSD